MMLMQMQILMSQPLESRLKAELLKVLKLVQETLKKQN